MISNHDRTKFIGASDTKFVIGNWKTKTWTNWFAEKLGFERLRINNKYTLAGTYYEHEILDVYALLKGIKIHKDKQVILEDLGLRVNLDGNTESTIFEVKTHKQEWKLKKEYWQQCQVQMYATNLKKCYILAYKLEEENYNNFFLDVKSENLQEVEILYDENFVCEYLEKLNVLKKCIKKGKFPNEVQ